MQAPVLFLISGLEGTGKTTLAAELTREFAATATMLPGQVLAGGTSVVIECVMSTDIREEWKAEAAAAGARCFVIECICSDRDVHQHRVARRHASGSSPITWQTVIDMMRIYVPDPMPDYVADATYDPDHHLRAITAALKKLSRCGFVDPSQPTEHGTDVFSLSSIRRQQLPKRR